MSHYDETNVSTKQRDDDARYHDEFCKLHVSNVGIAIQKDSKNKYVAQTCHRKLKC